MNRILICLFSCCIWHSWPLAAQSFVISNQLLKIVYHGGSQVLEVTDVATGKVFLRQGQLADAGKKATYSQTQHAEFGQGKLLHIPKIQGGYFTVSLYANLPFVAVQETKTNHSPDNMVIHQAQPFSFSIDLQKSTDQLKTLGTGGLLPAAGNPGSYVFLTTVDPLTRHGVVAGWLTHERGSGVLFSDTSKGLVRIATQIDYGRLSIPARQSTALETLLVGYFSDARVGEEALANAMAKQYHIRLPERRAVYCTWYSEKNGGAGNSHSTQQLSQYAAANLRDYGFGTIQLDDQWQGGKLYNGPARGFENAKPDGPYPNGMAEPANHIKAAGLTAGIWWMPFARNHQAPEYQYRQHWFARRTDGTPYETKWGGTSLDLTHPEVQRHIAGIATAMKNWGYRYFKMDGLWTGTVTEQVYINDGYKDDHMGNCLPLYDSATTQVEAYRSGLKLLRSTVGRDVFFSGCCVSQNMRSFGASIGLVDAMRVGPDFNHDGQSIRTGAIRASRLYFLNGRVWWNDPDPSIIRESGTSPADGSCTGIGPLLRARLLPSWVAVTGQFFLSSDWLPDLPSERIDIMKRCMASHKGMARPVDAFDNPLPAIWLAQDRHTGTERSVLGLFNWDTTNRRIGCNTVWAGLHQSARYYAFDFWENKPLPDIQTSFQFGLPGESCKIIALRAATNHPVLVSTSAHVTQGMTDVIREGWSGNTLSGESRVVANDPYELRIAGLQDGGHWELYKLAVSGSAQGVTIEKLPAAESGWVRIVIRSKATATVKWQIQFKKSTSGKS